jgi:hypothetical protein
MNNIISFPKTKDGTRLENDKDNEIEIVSYYVDLLMEENCSRGNSIHKVTSHIPSIVTDQYNTFLMHPITHQEVDSTVMQMK